jgi:hypothetical protein
MAPLFQRQGVRSLLLGSVHRGARVCLRRRAFRHSATLPKATVIVSLAAWARSHGTVGTRPTPSGGSAGKGGDVSVARSGRPPGGLSVSTTGVTMSSRQVFGVVVRTLGLLVILAGGHRIFYAFASSVLFRAHFPWQVYLVAGLVYLAAGAVLMWRAEWFVRFAYGPEP